MNYLIFENRSASFDSYAKHLRNNFFSSLAAAGGPGGALTNPLLMAAAQAHKFGPMNPDTGKMLAQLHIFCH